MDLSKSFTYLRFFLSVAKYTYHTICHLSVQFSCVDYIHIVVHPLPSTIHIVFSFQTEALYPLNTDVHSLSLQHLVPAILSVCKKLTTLGTSYKWKHIVFIFLCQIYFTQHNVLRVYPHCSECQNFISDIFIYFCAEWWWFIILQREYSKKQR